MSDQDTYVVVDERGEVLARYLGWAEDAARAFAAARPEDAEVVRVPHALDGTKS